MQMSNLDYAVVSSLVVAAMFVTALGQESDVPDKIDVKEGEDLEIKWNYDYKAKNWTRGTTYWRYLNDTIPAEKTITLMLQNAQGKITVARNYTDTVEMLDGFNAGLRVKNMKPYNAGTYKLQMDFHNESPYLDQVEVTVSQGSNIGVIVGVVIAVVLVILLIVIVVIVVKKKRSERGL